MEKRSIARTLFLSSSVILVILVSLLGSVWLYGEYSHTQREIREIRTGHIERQRQLIQEEVRQVRDYIAFKHSQTQARVRNNLREHVEGAYAIATRLCELNAGTMSKDGLQELVVETLRPIRFNRGRGYFFATDFDGWERLFADRPEMEQKFLLDLQDTQGRYVIRDMIALASTRGEGFYEYTWTKPGEKGHDFPKIAFVKHFEPFDWFIGTGEYLDDMERDIQQEALERIGQIRFGQDGYIFVIRSDGLILSHPIASLIGENLKHLNNYQGTEVVRELLQASRSPEGDFVEYLWPKPSSGITSAKLSYAVAIPAWDWVIGAGVYLDDLERAIAFEQAGYRQNVRRQFFFVLTLCVAFIGVSLLIARYTTRKIQLGVESFMHFFRLASSSYEKIDPDRFAFTEFRTIGEYANTLVDAFSSAQADLRKSEEQYRMVSENIPVAVYSALPDEHSTTLFISGRIDGLTGYPARAFMDDPELWMNMIYPEDRPQVRDKLAQHRREKIPLEVEYRILTRDGALKWLRDRAIPSLDVSGAILRIDGFMEDITERQLAAMALKESQRRYRLLFEGAGDAIYVHDLEGRLLDANQRAWEGLGYAREELLNLTLMDIDTPECAAREEQHLEDIREKGSLVYESTHVRRDARVIPLEITSRLIEFGGQPAVLSVARDISERQQAEQQRRLYEASLLRSQKMESIGTLAGGIAHDFNNILAAIIGHTELAGMEEGLPQIRRHLDEVLKAGKRARDLVVQILTFSRQDEARPIKVKNMVNEVLKLLRASLPATIEIRKELGSDDMVLADPTRIHQVIMNLCTNAAHAMEGQDGVLRVRLEALDLETEMIEGPHVFEPGPYVVLSVSDTGSGIPPQIRERIFDPYFTTKEKGKGTGLGLAIVHGIVSGLGGGITVESRPGEGATFRVFLPRIVSRPEKDAVPEPPLPTGSEHILFVDDEPVLTEIGQQMLELLGYRVTTRTSAVEALELFRRDPARFDLMITDMTMPHLTGERLAKKLMEIRPDIPVILCTGYSEQVSEEQARALGIRAYVLKPLVMKDLAATIRRILDQS